MDTTLGKRRGTAHLAYKPTKLSDYAKLLFEYKPIQINYSRFKSHSTRVTPLLLRHGFEITICAAHRRLIVKQKRKYEQLFLDCPS